MSNTYGLEIFRNNSHEITLQVRDYLSRVQFLELKITLEQFALAVTGRSLDDVSGEVRGLENVGKTKVSESRCVKLPKSTPLHKPTSYIRQWLIDEFKEGGEIYEPGGWMLDPYIGQQSSVVYQDDTILVNYGVYKYVKTEDCETES